MADKSPNRGRTVSIVIRSSSGLTTEITTSMIWTLPSAQWQTGRRANPAPYVRSPNGAATVNDAIRVYAEQQTRTAAEWCADVINDGWAATISDRFVDLGIDEKLLRRAKRHCAATGFGDCVALAATARGLKTIEDALHSWMGRLIEKVTARLGLSTPEQQLAGALSAKMIPLFGEEHIKATRRSLQILGVAWCLPNDKPLQDCPCFMDLAGQMTKEQLKELLSADLHHWSRALLSSGTSTALLSSSARRQTLPVTHRGSESIESPGRCP